MRLAASLLVLAMGIALAPVSYFVLGGSGSPNVEFAATLFILSIMLVFGSAVLYELIPDRRPGEQT
jgi:predicted membrane channel-forming protein YqfA (hemolysin III family)